MTLSSLDDFAAKGIDGKFGILDIALEPDQKTLTGIFIENGKKKEVVGEFKILKINGLGNLRINLKLQYPILIIEHNI